MKWEYHIMDVQLEKKLLHLSDAVMSIQTTISEEWFQHPAT